MIQEHTARFPTSMPSIHMAAFVSKNVQVSAGYLQDFKYFLKCILLNIFISLKIQSYLLGLKVIV